MKPSVIRRLSVVAVLGVLATSAPALAVARSAPASGVVGLLDAIPAWAHGVPTALEPASAPVQISLLLKGRNQAELTRFVSAVSDPASSSYRHFLTNKEYQQRYAPSATEVAAAKTWLHEAGFTIDSSTGSLVTAHATATVVGRLFGTTFGLFRTAGALLRAPLSAPTLPSALRPLVSTVMGLSQTPATTDAGPAPAYVNGRPCSRYFGQKKAKTLPAFNDARQAYAICGYTPRQIRSAYGVNKVDSTGRGATVGIVDPYASPTIETDVNTWSRRMGLPPLKPGQLTQQTLPGLSGLPEISLIGIPLIDPQDVEPEESLDVEAVHEMAPAANIRYYGMLGGAFGLNEAGFEVGIEPLIVAEAQAVADDTADIISNSWGASGESLTPGDVEVFNAVTNEAAAKGITLDFSSGDSGDEVASAGKREADFPATSSGVTAVGGTTLEVGKHGQRISESYWGTRKAALKDGSWDLKAAVFSGAGGGGVSTVYSEPSWQKGIVPASETTFGGLSTPGRVEPDVSMVGDSTTGILIGLSEHFANGVNKYGEFRIGGTSVSCPLFSGLLSLAVAAGHHRLGMVMPTLYAKSRTAAGRTRLFYDPKAISRKGGTSTLANVRSDYVAGDNPESALVFTLRTLSNLGTLHALRGYDDSTGLGVPRAGALVAALS